MKIVHENVMKCTPRHNQLTVISVSLTPTEIGLSVVLSKGLRLTNRMTRSLLATTLNNVYANATITGCLHFNQQFKLN